MSYRKARHDFEELERIAELSDQVDLDAQREALMQNPTQAFAAMLYESSIQLWFKEHGISNRTTLIAFRHNIKP